VSFSCNNYFIVSIYSKFYWAFSFFRQQSTNCCKYKGLCFFSSKTTSDSSYFYYNGITFLVQRFRYNLLRFTWMLSRRINFIIIIFTRNCKSYVAFKSKMFLATCCKISLKRDSLILLRGSPLLILFVFKTNDFFFNAC